jgi:hypothetical protein
MTDEIRRALTEMPDEIEIGGKQYKIPPVTIAKLELLADQVDRLESLRNAKTHEKNVTGLLKSAMNDTVRAFVILTMPNGEELAEPTEDEIKKAKAVILVTDVPKISQALFLSLRFEGLLKNAEAPRETENSPGAVSSPGSSSSPAGSLDTSLTESALEV